MNLNEKCVLYVQWGLVFIEWQFERYTFISKWVALKRAVVLRGEGVRRSLTLYHTPVFFAIRHLWVVGWLVIVIIVWDDDNLWCGRRAGRPRRIRLWLTLLLLLALSATSSLRRISRRTTRMAALRRCSSCRTLSLLCWCSWCVSASAVLASSSVPL